MGRGWLTIEQTGPGALSYGYEYVFWSAGGIGHVDSSLSDLDELCAVECDFHQLYDL